MNIFTAYIFNFISVKHLRGTQARLCLLTINLSISLRFETLFVFLLPFICVSFGSHLNVLVRLSTFNLNDFRSCNALSASEGLIIGCS